MSAWDDQAERARNQLPTTRFPAGSEPFSTPPGAGAVVDRAEASMDVVVDHADVLHKRVHARGPDESVALRLQLLGERLSLRRSLGHVGDGPGCPLAGELVGLRERHEVGRRGRHYARVVDSGLDL